MEKEYLEKIIKESSSLNQVLVKLGKNTSSRSYKALKNKINKYNIDITHFTHYHVIMKEKRPEKKENTEIFIENSLVSRHVVKKRIINDKLLEYKCAFCDNIGEWNGIKISLILDHINGYNNDNRLDNLRFLCPNCNSTLVTHCRGHKGVEQDENKVDKRKIFKPRPETRKVVRPNIDVLKNEVSILGYSATGRKYGVSDNAIRKWIKYELK